MIGLFSALAQSPSRGSLVWDLDCPNLTRSALSPQADLMQLDSQRSDQDIVLVLPPISGHSSSLMQDLAKPISEEQDVRILHWHDPAYLSGEYADYGHHTQVSVTQTAIDTCLNDLKDGATLHVLAVCQSSSPTLIALNDVISPKLTLTLLASPLVDAPGGVYDLFSTPEQAEETLRQISNLTAPGFNGVSMLPGGTQLAAILNGSGGALRNLRAAFTHETMPVFSGLARSSRLRRISLLDSRAIPEKLLLEGLLSNFVERNHFQSRIDPQIPIHLVAGAGDEIVPHLQTFGLSDHLQSSHISKTLFSGLDHFDLFASGTARHTVSRELNDFFLSPINRPEDTTI